MDIKEVTIHRIPHRHNRGKSGYHFVWIILDSQGNNCGTECTMSEAMKKVDDEGWILRPNV